MDDAQAELLAAHADRAAQLSRHTSEDVRQLYLDALTAEQHRQHQQDQRYLSLVPTFLSLHRHASNSTHLLDSLQSFLSTFQSDLSNLSSHISALQATSHAIDTRLDARRQIESHLAVFLSEISLSPRVVDLFFETEPENRVELWKKAVRQLERVLEATKRSAPPFPSDSDAAASSSDTQAVREAREVAETCKNIVATKLRTFLISPYASIKASVTTNLQVLQTSILLQHHRPLYAFLARQMPRVAIDVQRNYVAAARLYFETAFRRYSRSLGVIKGRWIETAGGLITDASAASASTSSSTYSLGSAGSAGAAAMAFLSRPSSAAQVSRGASGEGAAAPTDPWELDLARLEHSRLDGPGIVLGYMADDASFRASPESLFRAISLVMVDNSCSEYTFLVRFFENLQGDGAVPATATGTTQDHDPTANGDPPSRSEESSSAMGDPADEGEAQAEPEPSVVQLSRSEQRQMKGRGASDEIFKQVLEPALSNWTTFVKSLLSPPPPLLALLTMLRLNDTLLKVSTKRGCTTPLLESALMGFKLQAFPILKRQLDEQVEAVKKLNGPTASSTATTAGRGAADPTPSSAAGLDLMKGMFRAAVGGGTGGVGVKEETVKLIVTRYASLYARMVYLFEEEEDEGLFGNLLRLRKEVETLIAQQAEKTTTPSPSGTQTSQTSRTTPASAGQYMARMYDTVLKGLESGPASMGLMRLQSEMAHWNELDRLRRSL